MRRRRSISTLGEERQRLADGKFRDVISTESQARCKLDLYLPATGQNFPVLVWFHGGALKSGSKAILHFIANPSAATTALKN